jgi:tetratricopeptide (TPR) repeat protein
VASVAKPDITANLEALLARGTDNAGLRLALASLHLDAGRVDIALGHAEAAVAHDPRYSAAWKALGRVRERNGDLTAAIEAYDKGIAIAEERGDQQAAKEMRVFRKRLQAQSGRSPTG